MTSIVAPAPYGYTVFCDDIRMEVGNKFSLMGMYNNSINVVGEAPYVFPKFAFFVTYVEARNASPEPLKLQIAAATAEGPELIFSTDLPLPPAEMALDPFYGDDFHLTAQFPIVLNPLTIKSEGLIEVVMKRGEDFVHLGSIAVRAVSIEQHLATLHVP